MDIDSLLLVLSCPASDTSAGVPNILLSRPSIVFMIDRTSMGWIPVETVPLAGSDDRLNTRHRVFESASLPLSKRQRVGSESSESVSSESMVGLESIGMVSQSTLPSEDEILLQMIQQSGAQSYDQVVQFCLSAGIPLSRMFRLDLMRQTGPGGFKR